MKSWWMVVMLLALAAVARADQKDGLWEVTSTLKGPPGMPVFPPQTHTQCLTAKDRVPHPPRDKNCSTVEVKQTGDQVSWHVKCADARGTFDGEGSLKYAGDHFTGSVVMKMNKGGENVQMTQTLEGRRVGDCPK
jgi:hypothetical protein